MMKSARTALIVLVILTLGFSVLGAEWMAPFKYGDKGHLVGGKIKWTYHEIDRKNPIMWKAKGPVTVKLYVRSPEEEKAVFAIYIDGDKYKEIEFEENLSDKFTISIEETDPTPVTEAYTQKIRLGKGDHTIQITTSQKLYVRLTRISKKSRSIAPASYKQSLSLIAGDTKTTYYAATRKDPAIFEYNGSGTLEVWTRLAFSKTMKGTQHYTIVVEQQGKTPRRMKLETEISETSILKNDGDVIPGKARRFKIDLGKGKNSLKLYPDNTPAPYCAMRFKVIY